MLCFFAVKIKFLEKPLDNEEMGLYNIIHIKPSA